MVISYEITTNSQTNYNINNNKSVKYILKVTTESDFASHNLQ